MFRPSRLPALLVFAFSLSLTLCTGRAAVGDPLPSGSVAGDFNADGRLDMLVQPADSTHPGRIVLQDGTGALSIQVQVIDASFLGLDWLQSDSVAYTGDFNGDGQADVLLQSKHNDGVNAILLTDATSQLNQIAQKIPANYMGVDWSAAVHQPVIGDFNGDGHSDVLLQAVKPDGMNLIVEANAQGQLNTTGQGWMNGYLGRDWSAKDVQIYTGDFNGDGKADVLLQTKSGHETNGQSTYALILADDQGKFAQIAQMWNAKDLGADWSPATHSLSVRDINGDGIADIVLTSTNSNSENYAFLGERSGSLTRPAVSWRGSKSAEDALRDAEASGQISVVMSPGTSAPTTKTASPMTVTTQSTTVNTSLATASLPTTVGTMNGQSGVSGGTATYSIPIVVPPGRAGMQPSLSLNYSSKGGNGDLGMGWSLGGLSSISRCPETMAQDGRNRGVTYSVSADRLCLDGQRLIAVKGTYGQAGSVYRTELDSNIQVKLSGGDINSTSSEFEVDYPNGNKAFYGANSNGIASNALFIASFVPSGVTAPLVWAIGQQQDTSENNVVYTYQDFGNGEYHVSSITYTGTSSGSTVTQGDRKVVFGYEMRTDPSSSYLGGGETMETQRLVTVTTYIGSSEVRQYVLKYAPSNATQRSLLQSVQECGFDSGGAEACYVPTSFTWQNPKPAFKPVSPALTLDKSDVGATLAITKDYLGNGLRQIEYSVFGSTPHHDLLQLDTKFNASGMLDYTGPLDLTTQANQTQAALDIEQGLSNDFTNDGAADILFQSTTSSGASSINIAVSAHQNAFGFEKPVDTGITVVEPDANLVASGDFSGIGRNDIIVSRTVLDSNKQSTGTTEIQLYINSGGEKFTAQSSTPLASLNDGCVDGNGNKFAPVVTQTSDMDGNGVPDLLVNTWCGTGSAGTGLTPAGVLFLSQNSSHVVTATYKTFAQMGVSYFQNYAGTTGATYKFMDINGDGLQDIVYLTNDGTGDWYYQLNKGSGTFTPQWDTNIATGSGVGKGLMVGDLNGDGKDELLYIDSPEATWCIDKLTSNGGDNVICGSVLLSQYAQFDQTVYHYKVLSFEEDAQGHYVPTSYDYGVYATANSQIGDLNGDGMSDVFYDIDNSLWTGWYGGKNNDSFCDPTLCSTADGLQVQAEQSPAPDLMTGVVNGLGAQAKWQYNSLAQILGHANTPFYKLSGSCSNVANYFCFTSSMYVVTEYQTSNSIGSFNTHTYGYENAIYNNQGRGFQGFKVITDNFAPANDSKDDTSTVRTYNNSNDFPLSDTLLTEIVTATETGQVLSEVSNTWVAAHPSDCLASSDVFWQQLKQSEVKKYGTKGDLQATTDTNYTYDGDGNATNIDAVTTDATGAYETKTANNYAPDCAAWWPDRFSSTNSKTVTSTVTYDTLPVSAAAAGITRIANYTYNSLRKMSEQQNVAEAKDDPSSAIEKDSSYTYDSYGNTNSITISSPVTGLSAISARTVKTDFTTTDGYLVDSITNAADQITQITPDLNTGEPKRVIAPNGVTTDYSYDAFGRKFSEQITGPITLPATVISYTTPDSVCSGTTVAAVYSVTTRHAGAPGHTVCYDALNEVLRSSTDSFSNGVTSIQDTEYDNLGRVTKTSEPYLSTSNVTYWNTVNGYDVLNRVTKKTDAEGVITQYVYTGLTTTTTTTPPDRPAFSTEATDNALGKLLSTQDPNGSVTQFRYDAQGNPVLIQDAAINQAVAVYNPLGQKTEVTDPDMGHSTYVYDVLGNLKQQTDAKGQQITQTYDVLNRLLTRIAPDKSSAWTYDTCSTGQLCSVTQIPAGSTSADYSKTYTYDGLGRVTDVAETIDGGTPYHTSTGYDSEGRVDTVTYPESIPDAAPVTTASVQQASVTVGDTVTLIGTATDSDSTASTALQYQWTQLPNAQYNLPNMTLSDPTGLTTTFTATTPGVYTFQFTANDSLQATSSTVTVTVKPGKPASMGVSPLLSLNGSYTASWGTSSSAQSYALFASLNGGGATRVSNCCSGTTDTFSGMGSHLQNDTYAYFAEGYANGVYSDPSPSASTKVTYPPATPTGGSVPSKSAWDGSFTASWSGSADAVQQYQVQVGQAVAGVNNDGQKNWEVFATCTLNSSSPNVVKPPSPATSCKFGSHSVSAGTYAVHIVACNGANNCSAPEGAGSVTVWYESVPGAPTLSGPSTVSGSKVPLMWSTGSGTVTYYLLYANYYYYGGGSSGYHQVYDGPYTSHPDNTDGTVSVADYAVKACNNAGCSGSSNAIAVALNGGSGGGGGCSKCSPQLLQLQTTQSPASSSSAPAAGSISSPATSDSGQSAPPASTGGPLAMLMPPSAAPTAAEPAPAIESAVASAAAPQAVHAPFAPPVYQYYAKAQVEPAAVTQPIVGLTVKYHYTAAGYLNTLNNNISGKRYWQADALTAQGQVAQETYGNGVVSTLSHDEPMSRITGISNSVQNLSYHWDSLGNLDIRTDSNHGLSESFSYDTLNRLTGGVLTNGTPSSPISTSYSYDALGNITCKSDVVGHDCVADPTGYTYGSGAGPHAVTSITGASAGTYQYDADGNMTNRNGTVIAWNSDNLPICMDAGGGDCSSGSDYSAFSYAPDKHRYQQTAMISGVMETTEYVGDYEAVTKSGVTYYRHHLSAYGREVAEITLASDSSGNPVITTDYILTDHLGSVDVVMSASGNQFMSFGAFGKRRDVTTWTPPIGSIETQADHDADRYGFTHQEMLDNVALIHMNGRVYDPNLGRFLSVDPVFEFPTNTQSLNPYSYVLNNPLSLTDPTGYTIDQCTVAGGTCGTSVSINGGWGGSLGHGTKWWNDSNGKDSKEASNSEQTKATDTSTIGDPSTTSKKGKDKSQGDGTSTSGVRELKSLGKSGQSSGSAKTMDQEVKLIRKTFKDLPSMIAYYKKLYPERTDISSKSVNQINLVIVRGFAKNENANTCKTGCTVGYVSPENLHQIVIFAGAALVSGYTTEGGLRGTMFLVGHEFEHTTATNQAIYRAWLEANRNSSGEELNHDESTLSLHDALKAETDADEFGRAMVGAYMMHPPPN